MFLYFMQELDRMKLLLGDPALFTADIIINLLLSYRDIQVEISLFLCLPVISQIMLLYKVLIEAIQVFHFNLE